MQGKKGTHGVHVGMLSPLRTISVLPAKTERFWIINKSTNNYSNIFLYYNFDPGLIGCTSCINFSSTVTPASSWTEPCWQNLWKEKERLDYHCGLRWTMENLLHVCGWNLAVSWVRIPVLQHVEWRHESSGTTTPVILRLCFCDSPR